jgi:V/A-type H+/Na+-transporting ATPase subunit C
VARLDYANARLGARRGRLLGAAGLRGLLACGSLEARVAFLRGRALCDGLAADLGADPLARVEAALRDAWRAEAEGVASDAEGARARRLLAAFLGLDEALAVKAVLRGVAQGLPPDRTLAAAVPVPGLGQEALRAAASAVGIEAALDALAEAGCALVPAVRAALPLPDGAGLLPLEIAADRAALARASAACRGGEDGALLRAHVQDRADVRNAETLLALAGAPPAGDLFVPGGRRLGAAEFAALAGAPAAQVRAAIAGAFRVREAELAAPWSAQEALDRAIAAPLRRDARRRPLSLAVPLSYLSDRLAEVRRAAIVLRGAALGVDGAELLDLVEA